MNWYASAMDCLVRMDGEQAKDVVLKIAREHPKLIVMACKRHDFDWVRECKALLLEEKKIEAIKLWKEKTGCGLSESVDAINALKIVIMPDSG